MDILSYLTELIQTHKEVGVSGLGTFLKKKSPGRYDHALHSFLPPSNQLAFNPEVTENNLLSAYISNQHNISRESANYHIDQFVKIIKQQLEDQQEASLKKLGKLILTDKGLSFQSSTNLDLDFEFYGLPAITEDPFYPSLEETANEPDEDVSLETIIFKSSFEEENPDKLPEEIIYKLDPEESIVADEKVIFQPEVHRIIEPQENHEAVNYQIEEQIEPASSNKMKIIIGLMILLILVIGLLFLNPQWFESLTQEKKTKEHSALPVNKSNLNRAADSLSKPDTLKQDSLQKDVVKADSLKTTLKTISAPAVLAPGAREAITFEIIGSSVYSQKEADNFISFMKRKWGIDAKIVSQRPGKKIKISIATFKNEKAAREERARLEEKIKIPGIYIYTNTHKPE